MYSKVASRYTQSHVMSLFFLFLIREIHANNTECEQNANILPTSSNNFVVCCKEAENAQNIYRVETREPLKAFPNKRILRHLRQFLQLQQLIQEVIYFHHSETSVWKYLCQFICIEVHLFASGDSQLSHVFLISATEVMIAQPQPPNSPEYKTG